MTKPKTANQKSGVKRGRPPLDIDYDQVLTLSAQQNTEYDIAYKIGMTPEGFSRRKPKDPELVQALEKGRALGRISFRQMQYKSAKDGNVTAQIWCGKQYLGQRDKHDVEQTGSLTVNIIKPDRSKD